MRLALTGSSSTGKSTLAERLMLDRAMLHGAVETCFREGARELLVEMGHGSMDRMTREETQRFQVRYFERKRAVEATAQSFLTERSFVDVAAYWLERDDPHGDCRETGGLVDQCRLCAKQYSMHFYLPFGLIPFESDGYRSTNIRFHKRIDERIRALLEGWQLDFLTLDRADIDWRVETIRKWILAAASNGALS